MTQLIGFVSEREQNIVEVGEKPGNNFSSVFVSKVLPYWDRSPVYHTTKS